MNREPMQITQLFKFYIIHVHVLKKYNAQHMYFTGVFYKITLQLYIR